MNSSRIVELLGGITEGITALVGGANDGSTPEMTEGINVIAVVATAGDSVRIPAGIGINNRLVVANNAANKADIFPPSGGTINGAVADVNLGILGLSVVELMCTSRDGLTWLMMGASTAQS
jgi:hypothetical protein